MVTTLNTNYDFDMYHKNKLMRFEEKFFFYSRYTRSFFLSKTQPLQHCGEYYYIYMNNFLCLLSPFSIPFITDISLAILKFPYDFFFGSVDCWCYCYFCNRINHNHITRNRNQANAITVLLMKMRFIYQSHLYIYFEWLFRTIIIIMFICYDFHNFTIMYCYCSNLQR